MQGCDWLRKRETQLQALCLPYMECVSNNQGNVDCN